MKNYILLLSLPLLIIIFVASPLSANFLTLPSYLPITVSIIVTIIFLYLSHKKPIANSQFITILFLLGMLLRIAYLSDTPYSIRSHDVQGHLDYIEYVAKNHSLPSAKDCWECYHPPLYYLIVSPVCGFTSCGGNSLIILQLISLLFSAGFLFFGIKLLRLYLPPEIGDKYFNLASALLIFWPSGIINSIAINNDAFLYFFIAAGLYFITQWFVNGRPKNMWLAFGFLAASLLTKSNGIILLGVVCFAALLRFILYKNKKEALYNGLKILLLIVFILFFVSFKPVQNYKRVGLKGMLVANASGITTQLTVGNKIDNFTTFNIKEFLQVPYVDPWNDKGGRQYFSNYFLKTSLFGEFNFWQDVLKNQAILMSYLLLFLVPIIILGILFSILYIVKYFNGVLKKITPCILITPTILLFISALIFLRYLYPYACSGDFRYIYPIIIPISAVIGYAIYILDKSSLKLIGAKKSLDFSLLARLGEIIIYAFIITSSLFFVSMVIL